TDIQQSLNRPERTQSRLKPRLLAGVSTLAILAAASGYSLQAYSAETLLSPNSTSAARAPATVAQMPSFSDLVTAVKPAVVSVRMNSELAQSFSNGDNGDPFKGTPFEKFFRNFGEPNLHGQLPHQFVQGQGSGFFISADGYIVTNNHVVDHASKVQIVTDDGSSYDAKVVGTDPKSDLALIKLDGRNAFPFVNLPHTIP